MQTICHTQLYKIINYVNTKERKTELVETEWFRQRNNFFKGEKSWGKPQVIRIAQDKAFALQVQTVTPGREQHDRKHQEPGGTEGHRLRQRGGGLQVRPKEAGNLIKILIQFLQSHSIRILMS